MGKVQDYINGLPFADEYYRIFGKRVSYGHIFCPFHANDNTPAAKYYTDTNNCYCFVCKRFYGTYDLMKRYEPERIEEIKGSIIIEDRPMEVKSKGSVFIQIDRDKDISEIVKDIIDGARV